MGFLSDTWGSFTGAAGADAAAAAGRADIGFRQQGVDYLKERDELGNVIGDRALTGLADIYQGEGGQARAIDQAKQSALYQNIMGGSELGNEAILQNQAMTGGFRSGDTQTNLYDYNTRLSNKALLESYNEQVGGLEGLAGFRDQQTGKIADSYVGMGGSSADSIIAQQNAKDQGISNIIGTAGAVGSFFSDPRLKESIEEVGHLNGHRIFKWKWNSDAEKLGLSGQSVGVLAHLIDEYMPKAIDMAKGYLTVDYEALGINLDALNTAGA